MHGTRIRPLCAVALLISALFVFSVPSYAADFRLSELSDEEIVLLSGQVQEELVSRGISKTAVLAKGTYTAGTEIPAGSYLFTCLAKGEEWGNVTVRPDRGEGSLLIWEVLSAPAKGEDPAVIYMRLEEGYQLKSDVPFSLTIQPAVLFR